MPHSLKVWGIPPGKTNREVIAVYYDEAKLAEQKKTELEKEGYKEVVISMLYCKQEKK
jgi:hypothetical protein